MPAQYCSYYQAELDRQKTWFVVGVLRNEDHVAFERALDSQANMFEFFVPQDQEPRFLDLLEYLKKQGYVLWFEKQTNRLITS